ncbi:MAG: VWA domain-containing protein [Candidatus Latescibacteria bacterium]|nr:VWA domain-containing protein [Candidatus Latescibacterota bacterium]
MRWASPQFVHLLWVALAVGLLALRGERARRRTEASLGDRDSLRGLTREAGGRARALRIAVALTALALTTLGIMRPQAGFRLVTTTSRGVDLVLALDLSRSMDARDTRPDRLRAAKHEALALLDALEGSQVGLVFFAGDARVVAPLSTDREGLASLVETASTRDLDRPGTDLGAAISIAGRLLRRPGDRPRAIVLLSDGENLGGDPVGALESFRRSGARLYSIGVGTPEGSTIPIVDTTGTVRGQKRDAQGSVVISRLDEPALRNLARLGGGRYERADGTGRAALRLVDPIRSEGTYESRGRTIRAYDERFPWFAAAAGVLLLAERLVPRRRR